MHVDTSRYKPNTPMYDINKREGKNGYMIAESKYRTNGFGKVRSVQDVRSFPGLHHLQNRSPFPGVNLFIFWSIALGF